MDILVTGGTGFVGAHLCRRLLEKGYRVTVFHRPSSDLSVLHDLRINCVIGDLTDGPSIRHAVRGHEAVIHAAADLGQWPRRKSATDVVNVIGTQGVIAGCREAGVRRLVHLSSVAAIGLSPNPGLPANETCPFNLERSGLRYQISKKQAEDEVLRAASDGLDAVVVNPSTICGTHGPTYRGSEVFVRVLGSRIVPCYIGGRNVVHVDDVVDGILSALRKGRAGERYILGGENLTYRQMAEIAATTFGLTGRIFVPLPPLVTGAAALAFEASGVVTGRPPKIDREAHYYGRRFLYYDSSKAAAELDYGPRSYRAIVEDFKRFRSACPASSPTPPS